MKFSRLLFVVLGLSLFMGVNAAPKRYYMRQDKAQNTQVMDELHNLINDMKYETANHEAEIRMFEEKLNNQEVAVDSLWKQLNDLNNTNKEKMKGGFENLETKLVHLENSSNRSCSDIEKLKTHANDSSNTLSQYKQKISNLEKIVEIQNQNVEHLQAALKALMDALQIKDVAVETEDPYNPLSSTTVYQVKAGDSLEKIARKNNITLQKLREANHLTNNNDLIIVGQKLRLPE